MKTETLSLIMVKMLRTCLDESVSKMEKKTHEDKHLGLELDLNLHQEHVWRKSLSVMQISEN